MTAAVRPEAPEFDGRVAIVFGGSSGIGAATARLLAARGADVVIASNGPHQDLDATVKSVVAEGGRASSYKCDVTDSKEIGAVFRAVKARNGHVDVVVNAAGMFAPTPVFDPDPEVIAKLIDVNLAGGIHVCLGAIEAMRDTGGVFVAVTSTQAVLAEANSPVYAATKAGIGHFIASLAPGLAGSGIRVVAVAPGATLTPMVEMLADPDKPEMVAEMKRLTDLRGGPYGEFFQSADQVARTIAFVASDAARGINATTIVVDQGTTSAHLT
ncbi:MAG: hypothetical protein C0482_22265 [Gordonia sp.]|nr:hypothetical protein [Gordonia sp. (in: high G+C Gram-positive bacteria)]